TEKSTKQLEDGKYSIKVSSDTRKENIRSLFKEVFNVDVVKINSANIKPKIKKFRGKEGNTSSYKKMIISLKEGQKINFQEIDYLKNK
ncbi:50S ribosomal protein L23, partial [Flavobacteriaceae bacterium]|nr:50S ribosomal protein L23 [Flavobacteriaceae bacterium]